MVTAADEMRGARGIIGAIAGGGPALVRRLVLPVVLLLAVLPVLTTQHPPLFDYPNHLSRAHVLSRLSIDPPFGSWFLKDTYFIANVATDVMLVALSTVAGAEAAGRVLLLAIGLLTLGGAIALGRCASGRWEPWPAFAAVFLYGEMLHWGFLNYLFGIAVVLWGLAAWIGLAGKPAALRLAVAAMFAVAALLSHLVAFGLFAVGLVMIEIGSVDGLRWREPRWPAGRTAAWGALRAVLALVPALGLYVAMRQERALPIAPHFNFHPFEKISPFTRALSSGNAIGDAAVEIAVVAFFAVLIRRDLITLDRRIALASAGFVACLLVLPYTMMQSFFVDNRIAIAAILLLLASFQSRGRTRIHALGWLVLVGILAIRTLLIATTWHRADASTAPLLADFDKLERGSVLVPATTVPFEYGTGWFYTRSKNPPDEHLASWATIRADAIVPSIFAKAGQNPLIFDPPSPTLRAISLGPIARVVDAKTRRRFAANAVRIRAELDKIGFNDQKVYAVVFGVTCDGWPASYPFVPVACGPGYALVRVARLCGREVAAAADECLFPRSRSRPKATEAD